MASKDSRMDRSIGALLLGLVGVGLLIGGLYLAAGQLKRGGQHGVTHTLSSVTSNKSASVAGKGSNATPVQITREADGTIRVRTTVVIK
jgi:hypothetical protein